MPGVMLFPENLNKPVWRNSLLRRKIILGTFVSLALISFVGGMFVDYYFSQHNPRRPEPEVGRTYWVTADKVEVYVTKYELILIRLPGISFFIWFGAMLYFGVRWKFMQVAIKEPEYRARAQITKKKKRDSG
jgi:hypothetical protein